MPLICRFQGIKIYVYYNEHHGIAHVHAIYGEHAASLGEDGTIIEGYLPSNITRVLKKWMASHRAQVRAALEAVAESRKPSKIPPPKGKGSHRAS